ncbi:hypothetical protein OAW33_00555 [Candidatus Pelagibacter ubique]|nr:hypothetical protein [Candidatus Pelagibacter ubique]
MKKKLSNDWSSYYLYYILIFIVCGIFILYSKHDVGNDSSLSDWLINYSGGFVRRGLVGQIVLEFAYFFSIKLRDAIVIFQIISFVTYYVLVFFLLRRTITNRLLILSVFSPIFILFPIAEIEALGRKEIFILLIVILYFFSNIRDIKTQIIFKFFIFPISILIWEPAIIFYPYLLLIDLVVFKINKLNKNLIWLFLSYLVVFLVTIFVYLNSISSENFDLMRNILTNDFGENCYMSCLFVGNQSQNSLMELANANAAIVKPLHIIRYTLIVLIGFYPLFNLLKISKLNNKELFFLSNYKNLLFPFIVVFSPSLFLYIFMYDWGRIVHISYSFMLLSYIFLLKNNLIKIDQDKLSQNIFINLSNKMFFILFIIFCLCWNPKTVMRADIATNSFYKIIYNSSKKIFGFEGIRFFQDSPIIKFHKKYIE